MKQTIKLLAMLVMVGGLITFYSCSDDDDDDGGGAITLTSLTAGTIDLNGATAAVDVPVDAAIVAVFSKNVDEASTSGITLTRTWDDADVDATVTVDGKTVTITPDADLSSGAQFVLEVSGIKDTDDNELASFTRSFTTAGTFTPDGQFAYWNFDENADDQVGSLDANAEIDISYENGRNATSGKAASFNGTTSIIEVPNGDDLLSDEFSLSFWIEVDTASLTSTDGYRGHFVMGVGGFWGFQMEIQGNENEFKFASALEIATGPTNSPDLTFNADGKTQDNIAVDVANIDNATTFDEDYGKAGIREIFGSGWAHIVYTFSASENTRSLYINGELVMSQDFSDLTEANGAGAYEQTFADPLSMVLVPGPALGQPDYYDNTWAFGFWESRASTLGAGWGGCCHYQSLDANHFTGLLDDVRVWHRQISTDEIELMYNSEKP